MRRQHDLQEQTSSVPCSTASGILWSRGSVAANEESLEVEPITQLRRDQPWIVVVKAADGD